MDTLIRVGDKTADRKIRVSVVKQKNSDKDDDEKGLWLQLVDVPSDDAEKQASAVLQATEPPLRTKEGDQNDGKTLAALTKVHPTGLKPGELAEASGVNVNTLKGVRRRLGRAKKIREEDGRIFAASQDG